MAVLRRLRPTYTWSSTTYVPCLLLIHLLANMPMCVMAHVLWWWAPPRLTPEAALWQAMFFNPAGTDVHECAKALKDIGEKRIKRLPKAPAASKSGGGGHLSDSPGLGTPNSAGEGTAASQRRMADMMRQMEQMKRAIEEVKTSKTASHKKSSDGAKRKSGGGSSNKVMTFEDKRQLSLNINKLPHEKLGKVVEIIKKRRSSVVGESEEIEIDIDLLDNTTLKELDKYVKEALNPNSKPKPSAASTAAALQSAAQEVVGSLGVGGGLGGIKGDSDSESDSEED